MSILNRLIKKYKSLTLTKANLIKIRSGDVVEFMYSENKIATCQKINNALFFRNEKKGIHSQVEIFRDVESLTDEDLDNLVNSVLFKMLVKLNKKSKFEFLFRFKQKVYKKY